MITKQAGISGARLKRLVTSDSAAGIRAFARDGGDLNQRDKYGRTALWYAAADGKSGVLEALLECGAPGIEAIKGACAQAQNPLAMIQRLESNLAPEKLACVPLGEGLAVMIYDLARRGEAHALRWICEEKQLRWPSQETHESRGWAYEIWNQVVARFSLDLANAVKEIGVPIESGRGAGSSQFGLAFAAVHWNRCEAIGYLRERGVDFQSVRNRLGASPLHYAILLAREKVAGCLIESGISVLESDSQGRSPLLLAVILGQAAVVAALLERGANLHQRSGKRGHGASALNLARKEGSRHGRQEILMMMERAALNAELLEIVGSAPCAQRPARSL